MLKTGWVRHVLWKYGDRFAEWIMCDKSSPHHKNEEFQKRDERERAVEIKMWNVLLWTQRLEIHSGLVAATPSEVASIMDLRQQGQQKEKRE